jgi:signal transduction histidine kinase
MDRPVAVAVQGPMRRLAIQWGQIHSVRAYQIRLAKIDVDQARISFTRDSGFGLFNVAERFDYIGGTFEMKSDPGKGSCFLIVVPSQKFVYFL